MKIWMNHGSEHSYRLVLIGTFCDVGAATAAEDRIDQLKRTAAELPESDWDRVDERMPDDLFELLRRLKLYNFTREEVAGMAYLEHVSRDGVTIRVQTDDAEIQGLLKVLIEAGARVQIHSSHHWDDDGTAIASDDTAAAPDGGEPGASDGDNPLTAGDAGDPVPTSNDAADDVDTEGGTDADRDIPGPA